MTILHGIPNCDTVKKARTWLTELGVAYTFHDFKKAGVHPAALDRWVDALGWEVVLNRSGTTFRKLSEGQREGLDRDRAIAIMLAQSSAIKRPILVHGDMIEAGFKPERYAAVFA